MIVSLAMPRVSVPLRAVTALFLHSVPTSSDDWREFLPMTGGVAPDLIGFGRSAKGGHLDYSLNGYVGFIEELPGVNSHGRTLDEARDTLRKLAEVVFDEERRGVEEMIAGKDVVRENFTVPIPRPA